MARKLRVSVTYDVVTELSVQDGDTADNGYIDPRTERRRTFNSKGQRYVMAARNGRYDWPSLRAAIEFMSTRSCGVYETCWTGADDCLSIRGNDEYQGVDLGTLDGSPVLSVSYDLHIEGASDGTLDRLARMFARNGVYFANVPQLLKERRRVA